MTEASLYETILGSGAGGPLTAPGPWVQFTGYVNYVGGVTVGTPVGGNQGAGTINASKYFDDGVQIDANKYFLYTGGKLTGTLTLSGDPVGALDAATKRYVDNNITTVNTSLGSYLLKSGGTLTGPLILAADPTTALGACTKQYADNKFTGIINITDAPSDGTPYWRNNAAWVSTIDMGTY